MELVSLAAWGETMSELQDAARAAEDAGFDGVWLSELHRTGWVTAAAVACATNRVQIGTGVSLAFVRSPMMTALTALDLDELSHGRFILGLGSGVRRLNENWHGRPYGKPAPHLREVVQLIRAFMSCVHAGLPVEYEGEYERASLRGFKRPYAPVRPEIPVVLAAVGPMMLRLTGEIADGWLSHELGSPQFLGTRALPLLLEGLRSSGRNRENFTVYASACCVPRSDAREARRIAAGAVAFYATVKTYSDFFEFHGFLQEAREIQRRFASGNYEHMADACPDEMVDLLTLAGTPDQIRKRLKDYHGTADGIRLIPPTYSVPPEVTRECQNSIIEMFAR